MYLAYHLFIFTSCNNEGKKSVVCCQSCFENQSELVGRATSYSQFSSVSQLCPTLCDPMDCSTPGLPVHHQLPEFTQTHVH